MKRLFLIAVVLIVGTLGFGFFRGWFGAAKTADASGKTGLTFTWNKEKFAADMSAAGGKLKTMSQAAVDKIKGKAKAISTTERELEGKLTSVDVANHTVTLDNDGIPLTVQDTAGIEQLTGKMVHVKLEKIGDTYVVTEISEKK